MEPCLRIICMGNAMVNEIEEIQAKLIFQEFQQSKTTQRGRKRRRRPASIDNLHAANLQTKIDHNESPNRHLHKALLNHRIE